MYRVSWPTEALGVIHKIMPENEVLEFAKSIMDLGFTPEVTMEDD